MSRTTNDIGQVFGCYKVIDEAPPTITPSGQIKHNYLCECIHCNNQKTMNKYKVTHNNYQHCEKCKPKPNVKNDLTGREFGSLKVIGRAPNHIQPNGTEKIMYVCQCNCGQYTTVSYSHLLSNHTTSCGCKQRQTIREMRIKDLSGQEFGKLSVIEYSHTKNGRTFWKCQCKCGNEVIKSSVSLTSGKCKSCGCISSVAESEMIKFFTKNQISFQTQYTFDDCIDKRRLPFDFAIFYNEEIIMLVELQGQQHYMPFSYCNEDMQTQFENYKDRIRKDNIKLLYSFKAKIPLLRIKYSDFSKKEQIFMQYYQQRIKEV